MSSSGERTSDRVATGILVVSWLVFQVIAIVNGWGGLLVDVLGPPVIAIIVTVFVMLPIEAIRQDSEKDKNGQPRRNWWDDF